MSIGPVTDTTQISQLAQLNPGNGFNNLATIAEESPGRTPHAPQPTAQPSTFQGMTNHIKGRNADQPAWTTTLNTSRSADAAPKQGDGVKMGGGVNMRTDDPAGISTAA